MYRAATASLVYQGSPSKVSSKLSILAHCIKGLYLDQGKEPPSNNSDLLIELGDYADTIQDIVEDASEVIVISENKAYLEEHGITHLLDMLNNALEGSDPSLDTQFLCDLHEGTEDLADTPMTEFELVMLYQAWLVANMLT